MLPNPNLHTGGRPLNSPSLKGVSDSFCTRLMFTELYKYEKIKNKLNIIGWANFYYKSSFFVQICCNNSLIIKCTGSARGVYKCQLSCCRDRVERGQTYWMN